MFFIKDNNCWSQFFFSSFLAISPYHETFDSFYHVSSLFFFVSLSTLILFLLLFLCCSLQFSFFFSFTFSHILSVFLFVFLSLLIIFFSFFFKFTAFNILLILFHSYVHHHASLSHTLPLSPSHSLFNYILSHTLIRRVIHIREFIFFSICSFQSSSYFFLLFLPFIHS